MKYLVADNHGILGLDPELVEFIDARALRIEPDGHRSPVAELGAVGLGDERQREAEDVAAELLAAEIDAGRCAH